MNRKDSRRCVEKEGFSPGAFLPSMALKVLITSANDTAEPYIDAIA